MAGVERQALEVLVDCPGELDWCPCQMVPDLSDVHNLTVYHWPLSGEGRGTMRMFILQDHKKEPVLLEQNDRLDQPFPFFVFGLLWIGLCSLCGGECSVQWNLGYVIEIVPSLADKHPLDVGRERWWYICSGLPIGNFIWKARLSDAGPFTNFLFGFRMFYIFNKAWWLI